MEKLLCLILIAVILKLSNVSAQVTIKENSKSQLNNFQLTGQVNMASLPEEKWQFSLEEEKVKRNLFNQPKEVAPTLASPIDKKEESRAVNNVNIVQGNNFRGSSAAGVPPDNGTTVSNNNYIVHTINNVLNIYDTLGNALMSPKSLRTFFGKPSNTPMTDPRALYDAYNDRFIVIISEQYCRLLVAFSQTNNPLGNWNIYTIQVGTADFSGPIEYFDYPSALVNEHELVVSGFLFSNNYFGEKFIQIRKEEGYNGTVLQTRIWSDFTDADGYSAYPAHGVEMAQQGVSYGKSAYLMSTYNGGYNKVYLYEITDTINGSPLLKSYGINTNTYTSPFNASQKGSVYELETTDCRIQCAILLNGIIHFTFHDRNPSTNLARIIYNRLKVSDKTITSSTFSSSTNNYTFPSVASLSSDSTDHTVVICYLQADATTYPSINAVTCDNDMLWGTPISIKAGSAPINNVTNGVRRWGDYTSCVRKHNAETPTVWVSGQYGVSPYYSNWISEIKLDPGSGIQPLAGNTSSVAVYPNPVVSFFTLELEVAEKKDITAIIYDIEGKLVKELYKGPVNAGKAHLLFNKNALSAGIYFIKVSTGDDLLETEKIIIE